MAAPTEELGRLRARVQEALEEVHYVRDRVKKMCRDLGQAETPVQVPDTEYRAKLRSLLSCAEVRSDVPERKDLSEQISAERDELMALEKELQALQIGKLERSDEGGVVANESAELADERGSSVTEGLADAEKAPKTKAPGRLNRGSLPKPPPPKAKAPAPKAKLKAKAPEEEREDVSRLVNLHWRASQGPPEETEIFIGKDSYLQGLSSMMERWDLERADRMRQSIESFEDRAGAAEAERRDAASGRRRRRTVFSGDVAVPELPSHRLEELFQAKAAAFDIGARSSSTASVSSLIVDSTHRRILDLMVHGEAMQRQRENGFRSDAVEHAVTELLASLQRCDFSRLTRSILNDMRKVAVSHMESGQNIVTFVESQGQDALARMEHPHLHRLLYGICRIPAISTRLECLDLVCKFPTELDSCQEDLQTLRRALLQIRERQQALRAFWTTASRLGNELNGQVDRGFRLASLAKFMEVKSPFRKDMTFFHFVLLHLRPVAVEELTDPEFIEALKLASGRTNTVHQDVVVHLDGFRHLELLVSKGTFKGESIPTISGGDPFHKSIEDFVRESKEKCADLWNLSLQVFESYRDVGFFFNDLAFVYPPPGGLEDERRKDLFSLLCTFASDCDRARQEIERLGLGAEVLDSGFLPPYLAKEASPKSSRSSPPRVLSPERHEDVPRASFSVEPLSPLDPILASPSKEGPLLRGPTTPTGPPPARSLKASPAAPPPKRGPPSPWQNLPGTPTLLTSPTTSQGSKHCRSPEQEYCRATRKSLAGWAARAAAQSIGASAAWVHGEQESPVDFISRSSLETISSSSSDSRSSFSNSDGSHKTESGEVERRRSKKERHDLGSQLKQMSHEFRRRRRSGGSVSSASWSMASGTPRTSLGDEGEDSCPPSQLTQATLVSFMSAMSRKSRTPPLSPVKERGETPYRIACQ